MSGPSTRDEMSISLAADLDVGTVAEARTRLLSMLDAVEMSGASAAIDLEPWDGAVSPLSLQLLASAERSFPADRLTVGPHAARALALLEQSKEI